MNKNILRSHDDDFMMGTLCVRKRATYDDVMLGRNYKHIPFLHSGMDRLPRGFWSEVVRISGMAKFCHGYWYCVDVGYLEAFRALGS